MQKEKQIQIPQKLFLEMAQYFLLDKREPEREDTIKKGISDKFDAFIKHDLYTKYKTAATEEERESARTEYLQKIGMSDSFRW